MNPLLSTTVMPGGGPGILDQDVAVAPSASARGRSRRAARAAARSPPPPQPCRCRPSRPRAASPAGIVRPERRHVEERDVELGRRGTHDVAQALEHLGEGRRARGGSIRRRCPSSGCAWNVNAVTTPKLPPPPRSAQNSSACSDSFAVTIDPSASTTSASTRLSSARPQVRTIQPMPPPRVSPPTPTLTVSPELIASPCGCRASAIGPQVAPPPMRTRAVASSTSTRVELHRGRSRGRRRSC